MRYTYHYIHNHALTVVKRDWIGGDRGLHESTKSNKSLDKFLLELVGANQLSDSAGAAIDYAGLHLSSLQGKPMCAQAGTHAHPRTQSHTRS